MNWKMQRTIRNSHAKLCSNLVALSKFGATISERFGLTGVLEQNPRLLRPCSTCDIYICWTLEWTSCLNGSLSSFFLVVAMKAFYGSDSTVRETLHGDCDSTAASGTASLLYRNQKQAPSDELLYALGNSMFPSAVPYMQGKARIAYR